MNRHLVLLGIAILLVADGAIAQRRPPVRPRSRRMPVELWPPRSNQELAALANKTFDIDGWNYSVQKAGGSRAGVPWEIMVTPDPENAGAWTRGGPGGLRGPNQPATAVATRTLRRSSAKIDTANTAPSATMPDVLWKQRMSAELVGNKREDVVGIHFHELVTNDLAGILFSIHKVPPDGPDGKPPENYDGRRGTRIEATLLGPVVYHLDQAIAIREDPIKKELTAGRLEHEQGHAAVSLEILIPAFAGRQDWNRKACTGQRSRLSYYWKRQRIGRTWKGYDNGKGKLATLRTTVALVPPTRWSLLLPVPPERVTQKQLQDFNDSIVMTGALFEVLDGAAQARYHALHGGYQPNPGP